MLFAPTFRKGSALPLADLVNVFDFDRFTLVFRKHPLDSLTHISDSRVVVPDEREGIELLAMADHVVTDYSAIAFEATLLDIPLYFWAFDLDDYSAKRGFAMNFVDEAPGPIVSDAVQVVNALTAEDDYSAKYVAFRDRYIETRDFDNSERIVRAIVEGSDANDR